MCNIKKSWKDGPLGPQTEVIVIRSHRILMKRRIIFLVLKTILSKAYK